MRLRTGIKLPLMAGAILLAGVFSLPALEPWADERLPVQDGLELWLDASRENQSRSAVPSTRREQLPPVASGAPLDTWHDGSGKKRDVVQFVPESRPHLIQGSHGMVV